MAGNTFGSIFSVTTFGESHGPGLGAVIDGCPPGVPLDRALIQRDLDRRRPGQSAATTSRSEADQVEILSGVFEGLTTGTPIGLLIRNEDHRSGAYDHLREIFRPGHADLGFFLKFGLRDHRGGGRSSGRETVARVAAGAVARAVLAGFGATVRGFTVQVGGIRAEKFLPDTAEGNPLRCPDPDAAEAMLALILECKEEGDSVGGMVEVRAEGVPAGMGEPVFDKLDAAIAGALMGIGGVKGVELGVGFAAAAMRGSRYSDPFEPGPPVRSRHNRAGGTLGGISTGESVVARIAVKPTSSIAREQETVNLKGERTTVKIGGRHDPCLCPRIVPVAEAMLCLVLCDHLLRQRAQTGSAGPLGKV